MRKKSRFKYIIILLNVYKRQVLALKELTMNIIQYLYP